MGTDKILNDRKTVVVEPWLYLWDFTKFVLFLEVGAGQQADGELDEPGPGLQAADLRRGHKGHRNPLDQRYWEGENIISSFLKTTYNFSSFNISHTVYYGNILSKKIVKESLDITIYS